MSLLIALPCAALFWLERRLLRGRLIASGVLAGGLSWLALPIAAHVASGDGLRARGISPVFTELAMFAALLFAGMVVWTYRYWARRRVLDVLFGAVLCAGFLAASALLRRAQIELAGLLQIFALVLFVLLLHVVFDFAPRALLRVGLFGASAVAGLVLLGLFLPAQLARGRRLSAVTETGLGFAAARLSFVRKPVRFPEKNVSATCARQLKVPSLSAIALPKEERRNVILVSIDSVRVDFIRRHMQGRELMPALRAFMDESRYATRAHSAFPATLMAMTSAFTGNAPSDLLLSPKPYDTLFSMTAAKLGSVQAIMPEGNYFHRPDVRAHLLSGAEVTFSRGAAAQTDEAIERLRELRQADIRHLLWVHYFEPHGAYVRHEEFDYGESDVERYASELSYVDSELSRLLTVLRDEGWYEDSLIFVFSDHGESFGEHQHFFHHYLVYPWLVSVPFALHAPRMAPGPFSGPVQLMDITPTVLQFLGLPAERPMRGVPLLSGGPPSDRVLLSEEFSATGSTLLSFREKPVRTKAELVARIERLDDGPGYVSKLGVARGRFQLVEQRNSRAVELFDMEADPRAEHDLADALPDETRRLSAEAARFQEDVALRAFCELPR